MIEPDATEIRILERYQKVLQYAEIDPEVALSEARKTAEAILKVLYTQHKAKAPSNALFAKPAEKQMLRDLIQVMIKIKRFPLVVSSGFKTIQTFGNIGAHDQGDEADYVDEESIKACIMALNTVIKWFWKDQGLDISLLEGSPLAEPLDVAFLFEDEEPHSSSGKPYTLPLIIGVLLFIAGGIAFQIPSVVANPKQINIREIVPKEALQKLDITLEEDVTQENILVKMLDNEVFNFYSEAKIPPPEKCLAHWFRNQEI